MTGGAVVPFFETAWNVLLITYVGLLLLNSYFVGKRLVPQMTWFRFGLFGLTGVGFSQVWFGLSAGKWGWSSFMNGDVWMMGVIVSLLLLLIVTMKTLDRRLEV